MQVSCSVETMAPEQDCPPGQSRTPDHRTEWVFPGHWKKTLPERHAQEQKQDTATKTAPPEAQAREVSGSGWTDVQCRGLSAWSGQGCFIHDARARLGGMVTPPPRDLPFPSGSESPPHLHSWPQVTIRRCEIPNAPGGQVFLTSLIFHLAVENQFVSLGSQFLPFDEAQMKWV